MAIIDHKIGVKMAQFNFPFKGNFLRLYGLVFVRVYQNCNNDDSHVFPSNSSVSVEHFILTKAAPPLIMPIAPIMIAFPQGYGYVFSVLGGSFFMNGYLT